MRRAVAWALLLAFAVAQAQPDALSAGVPADNPFDYPETIIRAEGARGAVRVLRGGCRSSPPQSAVRAPAPLQVLPAADPHRIT
jgi:predicted secreted protein